MPAVKSIIPVEGRQLQQQAIEQFCRWRPWTCSEGDSDNRWRHWKERNLQAIGRTHKCTMAASLPHSPGSHVEGMLQCIFYFNSIHTASFLDKQFPCKTNCIRNVFVLVSCHAIQGTNYTIWLRASTHIIMFYFIMDCEIKYSCLCCIAKLNQFHSFSSPETNWRKN